MLEAVRLAGLVNDRGYAGLDGFTAEAAVRPRAADDDTETEMDREIGHALVGQVGPDLRQVCAIVRRRVQIDQRIALAQHAFKHLVRDQRCNAAAFPARKRTIQITPVGKIPAAGPHPLGVNRR